MSRRRRHVLTPAQAQEVIALYQDPSNSTEGIETAYQVGASTIYRLLRRHNIPLRTDRSAPSVPTLLNGQTNPAPSVSDAPRALQAPSTVITVDKQGVVLAAQREDSSMPRWEITVQGVMRVRAVSIEEAIQRAKSDPDVRKIVGARLVEG